MGWSREETRNPRGSLSPSVECSQDAVQGGWGTGRRVARTWSCSRKSTRNPSGDLSPSVEYSHSVAQDRRGSLTPSGGALGLQSRKRKKPPWEFVALCRVQSRRGATGAGAGVAHDRRGGKQTWRVCSAVSQDLSLQVHGRAFDFAVETSMRSFPHDDLVELDSACDMTIPVTFCTSH